MGALERRPISVSTAAVARHLDGEDRGALIESVTEVRPAGVAIAQDAQPVGQHGMLDEGQSWRHAAILLRGRGCDAGCQDDPQELLEAAQAVMRRAHAPYSGFNVGAALRGAGGQIHVGANVENASYSQAQCAEASAIGAMIAAGETQITAVAIVAERVERCPPCGGCRQRLSEFADPQTPVYLAVQALNRS